jgi:cytochrome P450
MIALCDQRINEGDAVTAWIASANRDENTFARAYESDFGRVSNRYISFGGVPVHLASNEIADVVSLPYADET